MKSPAAQAGLKRYRDRRECWSTAKLPRVGTAMALKCDPRHIGRVTALLWSGQIRMQWDETGWKSDHQPAELVVSNDTSK